jgi:hypothetical protein
MSAVLEHSPQRVVLLLMLRTGGGLNMREPWQARHRRVKHERGSVCWVFMRAKLDGVQFPPLPCTVTLTRISPSHRPMDSDNVIGALKGVRDQVAKELGCDDGDARRIEFIYALEKGPDHRVRVEIAARQQGGA